MESYPTFIDLFSGCGGFSLGMKRAGWKELAAIDFDAQAINTLRLNLPHVPNALLRDLTRFPPEQLDQILSGTSVASRCPRIDAIVGGPPCQGFSPARRVDGSNHGTRMVKDERRELYKEFLKYVAYFQPSVFVMENVLGIRSAAGGDFFSRVQVQARKLGYRVHGETICAWNYGVPQKRVRQLIIGTRRELPIFAAERHMPKTHGHASEGDRLSRPTSLWQAIGDLPILHAGDGHEMAKYNFRRRDEHRASCGNWYLERVLEVARAKNLTGHVSRPHSERDLRDFDRLKEGENSAIAMRDRNVRFEWPYSKAHFKDRYTRQHRHRLCSTIVAHLSKDGLMFIHPTQRRSLTPREAARIQSFPDWFLFPEARTHAFRLIGNAVPPLVAQAVGRGLKRYLDEAKILSISATDRSIPQDAAEALTWLLPLVGAARRGELERLPSQEFLRGWIATGFLCYGLHPESARDSGSQIGKPSSDLSVLEQIAPQIAHPAFVQSGWPTSLVPVVNEARRRFDEGLLKSSEYYCSFAHTAGARLLEPRNNHDWH